MRIPVALIRLLLMLPVLALGVLLSLFVRWMPAAIYHQVLTTWYRTMLLFMGIRARYHGPGIRGPVLMVSNHVSWADILVLGARWPFTFLAMHEVSGWPVVGWLAERVGTLFIRRGSGAPDAIRQVADVLRSGKPVILFPEGRTTEGIRVARFHPRIFQAAIDAAVPVQPVALVYRDRKSPPGSPSRVTFADSAGFLQGLWRTISGPPIDVEVRVFDSLALVPDRQELSRQAREAIKSHPGFTSRSQSKE
jgi:1-acyl-sn-glycerol-3-phosphate acyltransferase